MRKHEAYPSKYLKAADLSGPTRATVRSVTHEAMRDGTLRPVIYSDDLPKPVSPTLTCFIGWPAPTMTRIGPILLSSSTPKWCATLRRARPGRRFAFVHHVGHSQ